MLASVIALLIAATPGDTLYLRAGASYVVTSFHRDDIPATERLDRAAAMYRDMFGARPPKVTMFLDADGSVDPDEPPTARDTVRLAAADVSASPDPDADQEAVYALAQAWVRGAIERAVDTTSSDSTLIVIPRWLTTGTALLIAFDDADWSTVVREARATVGTLSITRLLGTIDPRTLGYDAAGAADVECAALVSYFMEQRPSPLIGLPELIGKGVSPETALFRGGSVDWAAADRDWRAWLDAATASPRLRQAF